MLVWVTHVNCKHSPFSAQSIGSSGNILTWWSMPLMREVKPEVRVDQYQLEQQITPLVTLTHSLYSWMIVNIFRLHTVWYQIYHITPFTCTCILESFHNKSNRERDPRLYKHSKRHYLIFIYFSDKVNQEDFTPKVFTALF